MSDVQIRKDIPVRMQVGVMLAADVYLPEVTGPVQLRLFVNSDAADTDSTGKLVGLATTVCTAASGCAAPRASHALPERLPDGGGSARP